MAIILRQWIDLDQFFEAHGSRPVRAELFLVQAGPGSNEGKRSPRQASADRSYESPTRCGPRAPHIEHESGEEGDPAGWRLLIGLLDGAVLLPP